MGPTKGRAQALSTAFAASNTLAVVDETGVERCSDVVDNFDYL